MPSEPTRAFKYDVAFSFLAQDLSVAQDLAKRLRGLTTFVYARRKEELLGRDGMDSFSEVFRRDARLSVILFRKGWGETEWTALEETAIKSRALETRFTSMMVVRLDKTELPIWIPPHQLYVSESSDTRAEMAAVIRARAKEKGAVVRTLSASEMALEKGRDAASKAAREQRTLSRLAPAEIKQEAAVLFGEIQRIVEEIKAGDPTFDIVTDAYGDTCVISSSRASTAIVIGQGNRVHEMILIVNQWEGRHALPSAQNPNPRGYQHLDATHYRPVVSRDDKWVWQWDPNLDGSGVLFVSTRRKPLESSDLAAQLVKSLIDRIFS